MTREEILTMPCCPNCDALWHNIIGVYDKLFDKPLYYQCKKCGTRYFETYEWEQMLELPDDAKEEEDLLEDPLPSHASV